MEEQGQREIQLQLLLLPAPAGRALCDVPAAPPSAADHPQLDLDLSMSIGPRHPAAAPAPRGSPLANENRRASGVMMTTASAAAGGRQQQQKHQQHATGDARAVKQQAAEQARMACAERAYAERVRELARRELELAEREFARARAIWERAREEVERVERMKQIAATRLVGSAASSAAALEITCHACMQRFHP
ncbi:protein indeterminate-domain 16 [Panicum miliaceum]|uniref:Protein indeterminate-domain 16 n=1 Tax=Panicum miliaceum TaxID=4540 RepID=A0A3L6Q3T5_PANMI|nr:protein indeterminate-domain 16 [Panicum miliaceum]